MNFFKPTPLKILFFIILAAISFVVLLNVKILPCEMLSDRFNAIPQEGMCKSPFYYSFMAIGIGASYPVYSYIFYYFLLLVVPYILACVIARPKARR